MDRQKNRTSAKERDGLQLDLVFYVSIESHPPSIGLGWGGGSGGGDFEGRGERGGAAMFVTSVLDRRTVAQSLK